MQFVSIFDSVKKYNSCNAPKFEKIDRIKKYPVETDRTVVRDRKKQPFPVKKIGKGHNISAGTMPVPWLFKNPNQ